MNAKRRRTVIRLRRPDVRRLADLLDHPDNASTEYRRYLGRLARTGDPTAADVIARLLDMPGVVGRWAASAMIRLARRSDACHAAVITSASTRLEASLDADEIRNARRVLAKLACVQPVAQAA
jgi:hypothetical protein